MRDGSDESRRASGLSYGGLVWRQFRQKRSSVAGLWIVGVLFLIAVLAPFLAGNKPLVMKRQGVLSFPVLQHLTHEDIVLLAAFFALVIRWAVGRWALAGSSLPARRRRHLLSLALVLAVLGVTAVDLLAVRRPDRVTDYKSYALADGDWAWFPPIPYHPRESDATARWSDGPSARHWLGTDDTGRDVASRLIHGARVSLFVGFVSVGIASLIGILFGALAGFFRGWVDVLVMRFVEIMMCFPTFFLLLTILAFLPRSIFIIMAVMGVTGWTGTARLIRAEFFRQGAMDYALAGQALGLGNLRLMFRHLLPNALTPVLVTATFGIAGAILTETALTFLGLGVGPETPSWGEILAEGNVNPLQRWHLVIVPGIAIFVNVLAYNLVGDGLRDAIDPRLKV